MQEKLLDFIAGCADLPLLVKYLIVVAVGFLPILEIRGAMVAGLAGFNLGILPTFVCGLVGNILLIFPVVILGRRIVRWLETTRVLGWFGRWMTRRTEGKIVKVQNISSLALFLFVAVPLPGTGVFTAGMIASFLDLRLKKSFLSLAAGVVVAGIVSYFLYALPAYLAIFGSAPVKWF